MYNNEESSTHHKSIIIALNTGITICWLARHVPDVTGSTQVVALIAEYALKGALLVVKLARMKGKGK
jgi:hypothetical protein